MCQQNPTARRGQGAKSGRRRGARRGRRHDRWDAGIKLRGLPLRQGRLPVCRGQPCTGHTARWAQRARQSRCFLLTGPGTRFYIRRGEPVAQMVEHLTFNQVVLGSSPSGLTNEIKALKSIDQRPGTSSLRAVHRQPTHVPIAPSVTSTGMARVKSTGLSIRRQRRPDRPLKAPSEEKGVPPLSPDGSLKGSNAP
jgi:hypothetical protein